MCSFISNDSHFGHDFSLVYCCCLYTITYVKIAKNIGVFARNYVKETSDAIEDEEYRVVDEEETLATAVQAEGAEL